MSRLNVRRLSAARIAGRAQSMLKVTVQVPAGSAEHMCTFYREGPVLSRKQETIARAAMCRAIDVG